VKLLKNLTFKLAVVIILFALNSNLANSQNSFRHLAIKAGIYEFTDPGTKQFYGVVPTVNIDYNIIQKNRFSIRISSGLSFTSVMYNSKQHYLYLIPLNINAVYTFTESDTKVRPFFGTGVGVHFKSDKNEFFDEPHYSITYGYNINSGLDFPLKNNSALFIEVNYIVLIPSLYESLDVSGIQFLAGYKIPIKSKK
jgi:hypothetical protein